VTYPAGGLRSISSDSLDLMGWLDWLKSEDTTQSPTPAEPVVGIRLGDPEALPFNSRNLTLSPPFT